MNFEEYIRATRTISNTTLYTQFYAGMYQVIEKTIGVSLPTLKTVFSIQKSAEIIELDDGVFLIYDQYFGQIASMFNRILLYSKDIDETVMFVNKLMAEELISNGQSLPSYICAAAYTFNKPQNSIFEVGKDIPQQSIYSLCQELFVIAHELAHWIIDNPSLLNRMNATEKSEYNYVIQAIGNCFGFENLSHQIFGDPLSYMVGYPVEQYIEELKQTNSIPDGIKLDPESIMREYNLGINIKDECCCDIIATIIVIAVLERNIPEQYHDDISIAVTIGLRHLRILGFVTDVCSGAIVSPEPFSKERINKGLLNDYLTRTSNLRDFLDNNISKLGIKDVRKWADKLVDLNEFYETIIDVPMYKVSRCTQIIVSRAQNECTTKETKIKELTVHDVGRITDFY